MSGLANEGGGHHPAWTGPPPGVAGVPGRRLSTGVHQDPVDAQPRLAGIETELGDEASSAREPVHSRASLHSVLLQAGWHMSPNP